MASAVAGEITAKDDTGFTLKLRDGGSRIVFTASSTTVGKMSAGTLGDLADGNNVTVVGTPNADGSLTANTVRSGRPARPDADDGRDAVAARRNGRDGGNKTSGDAGGFRYRAKATPRYRLPKPPSIRARRPAGSPRDLRRNIRRDQRILRIVEIRDLGERGRGLAHRHLHVFAIGAKRIRRRFRGGKYVGSGPLPGTARRFVKIGRLPRIPPEIPALPPPEPNRPRYNSPLALREILVRFGRKPNPGSPRRRAPPTPHKPAARLTRRLDPTRQAARRTASTWTSRLVRRGRKRFQETSVKLPGASAGPSLGGRPAIALLEGHVGSRRFPANSGKYGTTRHSRQTGIAASSRRKLIRHATDAGAATARISRRWRR